jgi:hypothetical protein
MSALASIYTDAVYSNLRPLRANWEPTQPIELGVYGVLNDNSFQRIGNVRDKGIDIGKVIRDDVGDQKIFASGRDTSVTLHAKGASVNNPAVTINASVEISFSTQDSAFFNAAGCSYHVIADKAALRAKIMAEYAAGKWQREWAVVTDLVRARNTTVVISGSSAGSIVLEAAGDVAQINLANAQIGLTLRTARNVGYQVIAEKDLAPLIGLSQIQSAFLWWGDNFKPLTSEMMLNPSRIRTLLDSPDIKTEPAEDLDFRQLF